MHRALGIRPVASRAFWAPLAAPVTLQFDVAKLVYRTRAPKEAYGNAPSQEPVNAQGGPVLCTLMPASAATSRWRVISVPCSQVRARRSRAGS
jgi:hypothetical protein